MSFSFLSWFLVLERGNVRLTPSPGMDVDGGHASVEALKKAGNDNAKVHVVSKAGHHLYLDNPDETNKILDEAIKALPRNP